MTRACPRCGQQTTGAFSEGGLRWAVCENCMSKDIAHRDTMRRQRGDEYERDDRVK